MGPWGRGPGPRTWKMLLNKRKKKEVGRKKKGKKRKREERRGKKEREMKEIVFRTNKLTKKIS